MNVYVRTSELRPGDVVCWNADEHDTVLAVEIPDLPAVVATVRVERNGRETFYGSGVQAWHWVKRGPETWEVS